ncbi:MAG: hypothetical protein DI598_02895 [Pseudopedobacter saltans]|uniref:Uncharacterized protein n=1 Tax=Pseudopedobacter saltans TaxID=151895 RepID=A0A2W5FD35_9SPHI|nr:MAG: hypothetical protein DI598_02895 [Pseudopedobacter saltans]
MNGEFRNRRIRRERKIFFAPLFILLFLLLGAIVYWLWNAILPEVLNVKPLKYPQALGLLVLCRILFGNFGWKKGGDNKRFGQGFKDRFRSMSDEERNRFREEWKRRCGR